MRKPNPPESSEQAAFDAAVRLLARREHSAAELSRKLVQRGLDTEHVAAALQRLKARGWQDDGRYAQARTASRISGGMGPLRVRADLQAAGVDENVAGKAMAEAEVDWRERLQELYARRYDGPPPTAKEWQRRYRFFLSRGFRAEDIHAVLKSRPQTDED